MRRSELVPKRRWIELIEMAGEMRSKRRRVEGRHGASAVRPSNNAFSNAARPTPSPETHPIPVMASTSEDWRMDEYAIRFLYW